MIQTVLCRPCNRDFTAIRHYAAPYIGFLLTYTRRQSFRCGIIRPATFRILSALFLHGASCASERVFAAECWNTSDDQISKPHYHYYNRIIAFTLCYQLCRAFCFALNEPVRPIRTILWIMLLCVVTNMNLNEEGLTANNTVIPLRPRPTLSFFDFRIVCRV